MRDPREQGARARTGLTLPLLGQGTWRLGEDPRTRAGEIAALRLGLDLGMTLIDTAEMYASGGAEEVVRDAIRGRRDDAVVVSKVLPQNASREGTVRAAERSLARLGTDRIDLYLLHWPGPHPIEGTLEAFEQLRDQGKIRHYGLSNFDLDGIRSAERLPGGPGVAANQLLYNLRHRGIESRLLPWCASREIVVMAYTPLDDGTLREGEALRTVAASLGATPAQVALAWTVRTSGVVAIAKATTSEHVRENAGASRLRLAEQDLALLESAYPRPRGEIPLETA